MNAFLYRIYLKLWVYTASDSKIYQIEKKNLFPNPYNFNSFSTLEKTIVSIKQMIKIINIRWSYHHSTQAQSCLTSITLFSYFYINSSSVNFLCRLFASFNNPYPIYFWKKELLPYSSLPYPHLIPTRDISKNFNTPLRNMKRVNEETAHLFLKITKMWAKYFKYHLEVPLSWAMVWNKW